MVGPAKSLSIYIGTITAEIEGTEYNCKFVGEISSDNKAHGEGVATSVDNTDYTYTGMFLDNKLHGRGIDF